MANAFRITHRAVTNTSMNGLQLNLGRMQKLQEQLSSGKQVSRPSDSPVKTVESMQVRAGIRRAEQYVRNADDGLALLGTTDSVLTKSLDMAQRARELTLGGMNDASNREARLAIAAEIDTLREGLIGVANTTYLDRPVFGGNIPGTKAYADDGSYLGTPAADAGSKVMRTVAPDTKVQVNITGEEVFGMGDTQLFAVLKGISDALRGPEGPAMHAELTPGLAKLDGALDRMVMALGQVGSRYNRVETMKATSDDQLFTMRTGLSEVEDIDLPKAIMDLQMQEVAYKGALGATARAIQPSLLDFLR